MARETGIVIDPHTACGSAAARRVGIDPPIPVVIHVQAHPAKFPDAVASAISNRIALAHQPDTLALIPEGGAFLAIAGHTHGGQIALPTRNINPARVYTRYVAGPYVEDGSTLYVSRGIGVGAVPLRVGAPPELDLITLRRPQANIAVAA